MARKKNTVVKSSFSDAQLSEFRDILFRERQSILSRLRHSSVHLESSRQAGDEGAEIGSDDFIRETGIQIMSEDAKKLDVIAMALRSIENQTYGICQDCHKAISELRLKAKPYARLCIDCKSLREEQGIADSDDYR
ncbi:MAG: TraR/DksA family transcriptional regulator [Lentisphaeria bacterium]|jgi:DnaK suppressor protein|nr:TraR/DksA family transcriptional regulator [Lentisphaeria bacterium]MDY0176889.1 TraR/DksA family transcriptional regulator [Lentisphaeria bacterium]NLZ59567.1 TraR/DksA family transcriptional regulator [Lentisphaerota bacterium]